jgi:hypothetical protein
MRVGDLRWYLNTQGEWAMRVGDESGRRAVLNAES